MIYLEGNTAIAVTLRGSSEKTKVACTVRQPSRSEVDNSIENQCISGHKNDSRRPSVGILER